MMRVNLTVQRPNALIQEMKMRRLVLGHGVRAFTEMAVYQKLGSTRWTVRRMICEALEQ